MIAYRCYLLDEDGHIKNVQVIECATDAAALEAAQRRLAAADCPAIEVWDKARRVGTIGHARGHWDPRGEKTSEQYRFLLDATLVRMNEDGDRSPSRTTGADAEAGDRARRGEDGELRRRPTFLAR